ncbi:hypothetical protein EZY14_009400 [Kordia sp. TARA_039_SRF]|nr:hypothetical protein EZY14_009400 [Kordia sp. TARA_039_SRF]
MSVYKPIENTKYLVKSFKENKKNQDYPLFYIESKEGTHDPGYRFYTEDEAISFGLKHGFLKYKDVLKLRYEPSRFNDRNRAFRWAKNTSKMSMVMLGCDNRYWVVCPSDASRLHKLGYEHAM